MKAVGKPVSGKGDSRKMDKNCGNEWNQKKREKDW